MLTHTITIVKPAMRQLRSDVMERNMKAILESINTASRRVRGWEISAGDAGDGNYWTQAAGNDTEYIYTMYLTATWYKAGESAPDKSDIHAICRTIATRVAGPKYGRWEFGTLDGGTYSIPADENIMGDADDALSYAEVELPTDAEWADAYSHLYGLEPHTGRVYAALKAAVKSGWRNRFNVALIGPPGCGKSDTAGTVRALLGTDAVWSLDATAMTSAGVIKELSEMELLPRVIVIEEIEKADAKALAMLLGILDTRGEVRKVTARGNIQRDTKCLAIATVNNLELFNSIMSGALASRFANKVVYKRPSRDTLYRILDREVAKVNGNEEWINPALDYCEAHDINDPRECIAICLCGGDDLLTGEYQEMLAATTTDAIVK